MKLRLKRETLTELTSEELASIEGGVPPFTPQPVHTVQVRECFIIVTLDQACGPITFRGCVE